MGPYGRASASAAFISKGRGVERVQKESGFWDRRSAGYDRQSVQFKQAYEETVALARKYLKPGDRALDFACGTGITTVELAENVAFVDAIDTSEGMLAVLRAKAARRGIVNIEARAATLDDRGLAAADYDAVMAFNVLCYLRDDGSAMKWIYELLKPGGVFLSATDCHGDDRRPMQALLRLLCGLGIFPFIRMLKTHELEARIASAGFCVVEAKNLCPDRPNLFVAAIKR